MIALTSHLLLVLVEFISVRTICHLRLHENCSVQRLLLGIRRTTSMRPSMRGSCPLITWPPARFLRRPAKRTRFPSSVWRDYAPFARQLETFHSSRSEASRI